MRICLFGQGPLCEAVQAALGAQGHELIGPYASPQPTEVLTSTQASVGLSCGYRHKLLPQEWECFPDGILNLHTSYLPWNKGAYPNVWPILDGSPAGVTLHRVDEGWDTGPILWRIKVEVEPCDTAKTLYDKLLAEGVELIRSAFWAAKHYGWKWVWKNAIAVDPSETGSFHRKADLPSMDGPTPYRSDKWAQEMFLHAINLLRARSFPGYGLRYRQDGKLLEATISIKEVTE